MGPRTRATRAGALALALAAGLCDAPARRTPPGPASGSGPAATDSSATDSAARRPGDSSAVQAEMHGVRFHIMDGVVLAITRLRGTLTPLDRSRPPTLDDKHSFTLGITSAEIAIDTASLGNLLSQHVFSYPGSPLKRLRVETEGTQLVQRGVLHGLLPFSMRADVTLTPEGLIRLHPVTVKVFGLGMRGLMRFFGLNLENLAKVAPDRGVRIEGNDFLLDPAAMLPPPRIRGKVTRLEVGGGQVRQVFGGPAPAGRLAPGVTDHANYMFFEGATLQFGKLTMSGTDLLILDDDPADPFDFSLDRYNEQLVAGYNRNTPDHGLIVHMPDLEDLVRKRSAPPP